MAMHWKASGLWHTDVQANLCGDGRMKTQELHLAAHSGGLETKVNNNK